MAMIFRELCPEMELSLLNSDMSWAAEQDSTFPGEKTYKENKIIGCFKSCIALDDR